MFIPTNPDADPLNDFAPVRDTAVPNRRDDVTPLGRAVCTTLGVFGRGATYGVYDGREYVVAAEVPELAGPHNAGSNRGVDEPEPEEPDDELVFDDVVDVFDTDVVFLTGAGVEPPL